MSEIKLNLIDAGQILFGTIHGSIADACVAALSAEPETISELAAALARYVRPVDQFDVFGSFRSGQVINTEPWDAGVVIIDLSARIVAAESSYFQPQREGQVRYHDGTKSTDVPVLYRIPNDWKFCNSIIEYEPARQHRLKERRDPLPLDARNVLYGRALLEFIVTNVRQVSLCHGPTYTSPKLVGHSAVSHACDTGGGFLLTVSEDPPVSADDAIQEAMATEVSAIHARWLMTPRDDLRGQSPREVLLAKRELIDFDLHTRALQWSLQGEGPPCLARQSFAYQFGGFGTHEGVVYYDLVRHLLWSALTTRPPGSGDPQIFNQVLTDCDDDGLEAELSRLDRIKTNWLENPQRDFEGRIPANIIENERRRLPHAMSKHEMIIDDDCDLCTMMANDPTMGPTFWHLDGSHMDDDFAFSDFLTREEWEAENHRREEFNQEFNRRWEERQQRIARGESVADDFDLDWVDSFAGDPRPTPPDDDGESPDLIQ